MFNYMCPNCAGENFKTEEKLIDKKYRKVSDFTLEWQSMVCVSAKIVYLYKCTGCGYSFEISKGTYIRKLFPGEFYVD